MKIVLIDYDLKSWKYHRQNYYYAVHVCYEVDDDDATAHFQIEYGYVDSGNNSEKVSTRHVSNIYQIYQQQYDHARIL